MSIITVRIGNREYNNIDNSFEIREINLKKFLFIDSTIKIKHGDTITYECDFCHKIVTQQYHKMKNKIFNSNYKCSLCIREETNLIKFGVKYPFQDKDFIIKKEKTLIKRYGDKTYNNRNKMKETKKEKYGNAGYNNKELAKSTCLKKYGVDSPLKLEITKTNLKKYNIEHYGVNYLLESDMIHNKILKTKKEKYGNAGYNNKELAKSTCLKKYGVNNPSEFKPIRDKITSTTLKNFYITLVNSNRLKNIIKPLFSIDDYFGIKNYTKYTWECLKCNTIFDDDICLGKIPRCPTCFPKLAGTSSLEKEVAHYIEDLGIKTIENDRTIIKPKELDIYIPSHNFAIEFDGIYWHSDLNGTNNNCHLNKTHKCKEKNINLVHIFEDEWIDKQNIVKSIIASKLNIYQQTLGARKCQIKEINSKDASLFYAENHLQGYLGSKINIGLFYENELVSCLSFSKSRYNKKYDWEITRFANKLNIKVVGSFAKLFSYFKSNYDGSIITYSDKRYFDGSIYKRNGFTELKDSSPSYYYTDYKHRYNRVEFQKHKLKDKLKDFDPNLTEWENMQLNGWDRIWDCGNKVFEFTR